ncbi:MAG: hypothetical protein HN416_17760, partial [Nitrospina sp.]|nr:hypothetical protein [Nitrospina sp.]
KKQTATELQTDERRSQAEAPSESRDTSSQGIDNAGETDSAQIPDDEEPLLIAEEPFDEAELQAFENYSPFLSPNPRRAKRIVNVYRIARQLKSNLGALAPEAPTLIKWMILSEQWPFRVAWIMQKIEDDYQLKQDLFNQPETSLEQVYEVVKPRVQDEKAKEFVSMDDDQEVFLMFIQQAPIITVDVVQKLRSLTFNLNPAMQSEVLKVAVTQDQNRAKDMIE